MVLNLLFFVLFAALTFSACTKQTAKTNPELNDNSLESEKTTTTDNSEDTISEVRMSEEEQYTIELNETSTKE